MRKKYINSMILWAKSKKPKPMMLWGARQVGKTHLMKSFAKSQFADSIYLNFEQDAELSKLFAGSIAPQIILKNLALYLNRGPITTETLVIMDEIQESERALNSLKYFNESPEAYKILSAGSLLGVKLSRSGFPVGQVTFLDVYPGTFLEFLSMTGELSLATYLENPERGPISLAVHEKILGIYCEYLFVGGMPEVISEYALNRQDFPKIRETQNRILRAYQLDFAKHAPREMVVRIAEIFDKIPQHLAKENKKFMYSAIAASARARDYSSALQWLIDARILQKVMHLSNPEIPLLASADSNIFKTYFVDTGLLGAMMNVPQKLILDQATLFCSYKGALAENIAAQQLHASGKQCFYWTSPGKAEVDFVFQIADGVVALEVKSGEVLHSRSLKELGRRFPKVALYRSSLLNAQKNGAIKNIPAYSVGIENF